MKTATVVVPASDQDIEKGRVKVNLPRHSFRPATVEMTRVGDEAMIEIFSIRRGKKAPVVLVAPTQVVRKLLWRMCMVFDDLDLE
jgi:hypothetical protein